MTTPQIPCHFWWYKNEITTFNYVLHPIDVLVSFLFVYAVITHKIEGTLAGSDVTQGHSEEVNMEIGKKSPEEIE